MTQHIPVPRPIRDLTTLQAALRPIAEPQEPHGPEIASEGPSEPPGPAGTFSTSITRHGWRCPGGPGCAGMTSVGYPTADAAHNGYADHLAGHRTPFANSDLEGSGRPSVEDQEQQILERLTDDPPERVVVRADQHAMPRRFVLQRYRDISGISGVGTVADGVLWPDGTASVRWRGEHPSIVFWDRGRVSVERIHGHQGATEVVFLDDTDVPPGRGDGPDSVRTPPDASPAEAPASRADTVRTGYGDPRLADPDVLREEYAAAIRAGSWAPVGTRAGVITDSVMAVHDRAMDGLRTALAHQQMRIAELEAANHLLGRQAARRVRAYADPQQEITRTSDTPGV
ncbi:hypothetical protein [Streptomyces abikoensis]|uniref:Uncharacterized protein n=1 Tax=Streptomyces abikoensis TaxID=97398 RepID=A0ABW7TCR7_9ACTN